MITLTTYYLIYFSLLNSISSLDICFVRININIEYSIQKMKYLLYFPVLQLCNTHKELQGQLITMKI